MTKAQDQIGKAGQEAATSALRRLGVLMVEPIGTPFKAIPAGPPSAHLWHIIWGEKVSGDHRGIMPDGTSVLAETKTILDRNLSWSDFREHQPAKLSEHALNNGLTLVVWVHSTGIYVMKWPIEGFGPHKSIKPDQAARFWQVTEEEVAEEYYSESEEALSE